VGGSYLGDLLPGFLLIGVGLGFSFVPVSIAALAGVQGAEAGLASGLINTTQQIGDALGIAIMTTVATTRTESRLLAGTAQPQALTDGFSLAFWVGVAFAAISLLTTLLVLRRQDLRIEPEPARRAVSQSPAATVRAGAA
jgi:MFS family permease